MIMRFDPLFRVGAWVLVAAGICYLYLAGRRALGGSAGWVPLVVVGVAAVAVGTSLLRWFRRADD
jgi:uncharacterized membrane protein